MLSLFSVFANVDIFMFFLALSGFQGSAEGMLLTQKHPLCKGNEGRSFLLKRKEQRNRWEREETFLSFEKKETKKPLDRKRSMLSLSSRFASVDIFIFPCSEWFSGECRGDAFDAKASPLHMFIPLFHTAFSPQVSQGQRKMSSLREDLSWTGKPK